MRRLHLLGLTLHLTTVLGENCEKLLQRSVVERIEVTVGRVRCQILDSETCHHILKAWSCRMHAWHVVGRE